MPGSGELCHGRFGFFLTGVKYELQHVAKDQRDADTQVGEPGL